MVFLENYILAERSLMIDTSLAFLLIALAIYFQVFSFLRTKKIGNELWVNIPVLLLGILPYLKSVIPPEIDLFPIGLALFGIIFGKVIVHILNIITSHSVKKINEKEMKARKRFLIKLPLLVALIFYALASSFGPFWVFRIIIAFYLVLTYLLYRFKELRPNLKLFVNSLIFLSMSEFIKISKVSESFQLLVVNVALLMTIFFLVKYLEGAQADEIAS